MRQILRSIIPAAAALLVAGPAFAHTGIGDTAGLAAGFMHPILGADHVLAMVTVGLFAAALGGRALWAVPTAFVVMMVAGGLMGILGVAVPFVEAGIAASIVVVGAAIALGWRWPVPAAMALVGAFAIFHGHAHGTEMDAGHGAVLYSLGFATATALLHAAGLGLGLSVFARPALIRIAGALVAAAGLILAAA